MTHTAMESSRRNECSSGNDNSNYEGCFHTQHLQAQLDTSTHSLPSLTCSDGFSISSSTSRYIREVGRKDQRGGGGVDLNHGIQIILTDDDTDDNDYFHPKEEEEDHICSRQHQRMMMPHWQQQQQQQQHQYSTRRAESFTSIKSTSSLSSSLYGDCYDQHLNDNNNNSTGMSNCCSVMSMSTTKTTKEENGINTSFSLSSFPSITAFEDVEDEEDVDDADDASAATAVAQLIALGLFDR